MTRVKVAVPVAGATGQYQIVANLPDVISCKVRQEYNTGVYQLDMGYAPSGEYASMLTVGNGIICKPDPQTGEQIFRIAKIKRSISDVISVTAYHISYLHASEICAPFLNGGVAWTAKRAWSAVLAAIKNPLAGTKTCSITSTAAGAFGVHLLEPASLRDVIYDQLIPAYGGTVRYDNMAIYWESATHPNRGVKLAGGVNVVGCTTETDVSGFESGIYPYYGRKNDSSRPYVDLGSTVDYGLDLPTNITPMDFSSKFESAPTAAALRAAAEAYVQQRAAEYIPFAIKIDRVPDGAIILPGDIVTINVKRLGLNTQRIVTAITYDVLRGAVEKVEVGDQSANTLAKMIGGRK